jgi:DNA replicative helicase MCM subunit Mcm2 (Cdc46/Mcm family)
MAFTMKLGSQTVIDGIRKMTKENFFNAYEHIFKRTTEDKWNELQEAIVKYNKANNIEPIITEEEIEEAHEYFVETIKDIKKEKKKKNRKKSSKK